MEWEECIEEAKDELGIVGWTDKWEEVIKLAKEKYWRGQEFKELKKETIDLASSSCCLSKTKFKLTAHHIYYGRGEETICLCLRCHNLIHNTRISRWGFVLQLALSNINSGFIPPKDLQHLVEKVKKELYQAI